MRYTAPKGLKAPLALTTLFAAALLLGGCFGGAVEGVRVAEVTRGEARDTISAAGVLEASQPVDVTPIAGGTIAALHVKEGDYVNAGEVLATLDQEELQAQAAQAKADYLTAASVGDILRGQWENSLLMYDSMNYASQIFRQMQSQVDAAILGFYDILPAFVDFLPPEQREYLEEVLARQKASYEEMIRNRQPPPDISYVGYPSTAAAADAARTEAARYNYERMMEAAASPDLVAPVSGYVVFVPPPTFMPSDLLSDLLGGMGSLTSSMGALSSLLGGDIGALFGGGGGAEGELRVGTRVSAGNPVFRIVDLRNMRVKAQVEETDIPMVREGQRAEIYLDAYPDLVFHGEVVQVGVEAETGSGGTTVFPVVVQMEYTDIPLRLGYNATVDIEVLFKEDVITVPVTALVTRDDGDYVFVVEEGKARLRRVETGERTDEWIEIVSGLEPGERIVVEGAGKVSEGQKVE